MNTVNEKVAQKLKEVGYPQRKVKDIPKLTLLAVPDFLTAADWVMHKSEGEFMLSFEFIRTRVSQCFSEKFPVKETFFSDPDHRNSALLFALNQIKK